MATIDGQSPITSEMYLINKKRDERQTGQGTLGKDDFMKLLIAQLQNQDPTNPMKDNEFIAQMAQFSALEQTMNLTKAFEKFAEAQNQTQLIQYNNFVGKQVKWHEITEKTGEDGKPVVNEGTGMIASVKFVNGSAVFTMQDGKELTPGNISEVLASSGGSANSLVEASMLIGKKVGYMDGEEEVTGIVTSVSNKDGKLQYILDDGSRIEGNSFTSISQ
ncbi:flagellar hook assembly protein FlgD [Sporosarcina sp. 179-K 3D1 HS]|uniref:flagellar hook assembly protein FlgD n=1 Tax=Sporosarcina sp. 179-K 3D1 HS TaxID=3232169 RepID=UPI0039A2E3C5